MLSFDIGFSIYVVSMVGFAEVFGVYVGFFFLVFVR